MKAHPTRRARSWRRSSTRLIFTPVSTPDGPRYELEGVAEIGRLLTLDSGAKWASPEGVEPSLAT